MLKRWIELRTQKSTWMLDMDFLLSSYECMWGRGCKGIDTKSADLGCCANGAYLEDSDIELLKTVVPMLTPENWQNHGSEYMQKVKERNKFGITTQTDYKTALVDPNNATSGCIFANREGFSGGTGCALHIASLSRGENPIDGKPNICWQMPLLVDYSEELDANILRMFHWTKEEYDWFCGHDEIAWVSENPLFQTMEKELEKLIGSYDTEAWARIKELCESAHKQGKKKVEKKRIPVTIQVL